jgi:hypothetical protein
MVDCLHSETVSKLRRVSFGLALFLSVGLLRAQQLPREALATFPADTQQMVYTNLAQLRSSPNFSQIRQQILTRQLRYFQDFLRPMGIEPDRDVDEVALGWRGEASGAAGFYGMATGRFQSDLIRQYFARTGLPTRQYSGYDLYAFGSSNDRNDIFFTFLDSGTAAFGRLPDLKAMIDASMDSANALNTNADFVNWEGELEGLAPQWGILNEKAAANFAAPWFSGGKDTKMDLSVIMRPVRAVLYQVQWGTGFSAQLNILCQDSQSATAIVGLLKLVKDGSLQSPAKGFATAPSFLQNADIHSNGERVQVDVTGPVEAISQIMRGG